MCPYPIQIQSSPYRYFVDKILYGYMDQYTLEPMTRYPVKEPLKNPLKGTL